MLKTITRPQLLTLAKITFGACIVIMEAKNRDYAGGGSDPLANFRASETLGVPPEIGLLMRCMDKFKRIQAFVNTGTLSVKNEPVEDAIRDVINYMILLLAMVEERKFAAAKPVKEARNGKKVPPGSTKSKR